MTEFTIRTAERGDVGTLLGLIRDLADYEHMLDQVTATEELLAQWIFEKKAASALLAEENGEPVGLALYFYNFSTFLGRAGIFLEDLYIKPSCRGKGYGKALLKRLAKLAVEKGCGRLEWNCLDWNKPSIAFYRSLGAVPMDEWTTYRVTGDTLLKLARE